MLEGGEWHRDRPVKFHRRERKKKVHQYPGTQIIRWEWSKNLWKNRKNIHRKFRSSLNLSYRLPIGPMGSGREGGSVAKGRESVGHNLWTSKDRPYLPLAELLSLVSLALLGAGRLFLGFLDRFFLATAATVGENKKLRPLPISLNT